MGKYGNVDVFEYPIGGKLDMNAYIFIYIYIYEIIQIHRGSVLRTMTTDERNDVHEKLIRRLI